MNFWLHITLLLLLVHSICCREGDELQSWRLGSRDNPVWAVGLYDFTGDNGYLVACWENHIRVYDPQGATVKHWIHGRYHIVSCAWSADGRWIVSGAYSPTGTVAIWDANLNSDTSTPIRTWEHGAGLYAVAVSSDGTYISTGSKDFTAKLWDFTGNLLHTLTHGDELHGLTFSPDATRLATGCGLPILSVYDTSTGNLLGTYPGHTAGITKLRYTANGDKIQTASYDGTARLWASDGTLLKTFQSDPKNPYIGMKLTNNEQFMVAAGFGQTVDIWDMNTNALLTTIPMGEQIYDLAVSADDAYVFAALKNGVITKAALGPCAARHVLRTLHTPANVVFSLAVTEQLVAVASDSVIRLFGHDGSSIRQYQASGRPFGVSLSLDETLLAAGGSNKCVELWDATISGNPLHTLSASDVVYDVQISPDRQYVAAAGVGGFLRIWETNTGNVVHSAEDDNFGDDYHYLSWSSDSSTVALGSVPASLDQKASQWCPSHCILMMTMMNLITHHLCSLSFGPPLPPVVW